MADVQPGSGTAREPGATTSRRSTGSARSSSATRRGRRSSRSPAASVGAKLADGLQALLGRTLAVVVNTGDDCRAPRPARHARPRHGALQPRRDRAGRVWAGGSRATRTRRWRSWAPTARRPGSAWATGTSRCTSRGRRGCAPGCRLTEVCLGLQRSLGIAARILPMTDAPVATEVRTADGWLEFQEYFVHRRQEPDVLELRFAGLAAAAPDAGGARRARGGRGDRDRAVEPARVVGPILGVPGMREAIAGRRGREARRVAAVSPDHRRPGAQGSGGPDARAPRPRGDARSAWRACTRTCATCSCWTRSTRRWRRRSRRWASGRRHRHDHDRRRVAGPRSPARCWRPSAASCSPRGRRSSTRPAVCGAGPHVR